MVNPHIEAAELRKPSIKERQRQLREDAILDAAETLLVTKGYAAMTLDDLITEVGVSKPTLYQHFRSKEELVASIMTRGIREATAQLDELEATLPPIQALRTMIEISVQRLVEETCPITDLCILLSVIAQEPVRDAEREIGRRFELLVEKCQADGSMRTTVPAMLVAQTMLSILKDWTYKDLIVEGRTDLATMKKAVIQMLLGDVA